MNSLIGIILFLLIQYMMHPFVAHEPSPCALKWKVGVRHEARYQKRLGHITKKIVKYVIMFVGLLILVIDTFPFEVYYSIGYMSVINFPKRLFWPKLSLTPQLLSLSFLFLNYIPKAIDADILKSF